MDFSDYIRDPQEIYRESWKRIIAETDLSRFKDEDEKAVAIRIVHACGMPEMANYLVFSKGAAAAARKAIMLEKPIITDVMMVAQGIMPRLLPRNTKVCCAINAPETADTAKEIGNTRAAAGIAQMSADLGGSVVVIGNAPTALFYLLELVAKGAPKPAVVLGFPVGFVGAAESKEALVANDLGIPYIALRGRFGGSAIAAAAVNALASGLDA